MASDSNTLDQLLKLDKTVGLTFGDSRMKTPACKGYYEILEQYEEQHILIGYSQGGLVARYLAFLDEYIFKKNLIAGVITIASPNYGSPVAHPRNGDQIVSGVVNILKTILPVTAFWVDNFKFDLDKLDYTKLYSKISEKYIEISDKPKDSSINIESKKFKKISSAKDFLETTLKWLSGIQNNNYSAFDELDVDNFNRRFSVLSLVNNYPPQRIYSGAIITGNNNISEIAVSTLVETLSLAPGILKLLDPLGKLRERLAQAGDIYSQTIMLDSADKSPISVSLVDNYIQDYPTGRDADQIGPQKPVFGIPKYKQDFVIPSVYQTQPSAPDRDLGHYLNLEANHSSGRDLRTTAGQKSWAYTKRLLTTLARQL